MNGFLKLFDFYINSSIHVSVAIVSFAAVTFLNFRIPIDYELLVFIFLASVTGYNFIKYAGIAKLHHLSLARNVRIIQIFSLIIFLCLLWSAFHQSVQIIVLAGIMAVFTVLYAVPVFTERRNLRGLPGIKIFVIAFVVTVVTVLMPLADYQLIFTFDLVLELVQRFCLVIAVILPFEIRDLKYDMAQLGTMPQILGVSGTKVLGYLLLGFTLLPEFLKQETHLEYVLSLLFVVVLTAGFLKNSSIRQSRYFASFWVEAIPVFWVSVLCLLQFLF